MQTQCPHCETKFRVTENQIQAADGMVRCGVCSEVFNAVEITDQHADTPVSTDESLFNINDIDSDDAIKDEDLNPKIDKDVFDLFDEEHNESLQHIVPEKYRDTYSPQPHSLLSTVLWSLGILVLTATLALEYIWFNRDQFMPVPEFQASFKRLCQHVECSSFSIRNPEKIELITRNVYSHPKEKDALLVDVTMKNNASFAQPYPVIQIDFSNIRGGTVAARRFFPDEYLSPDVQTVLLAPGTSTSVTLEIQDPGKQAMTYEFNFL